MFVFAVFAWNFFVSNTFSDAIYVIKNAFVGISSLLSYIREGFVSIGISKISLATILLSILVLVLYDLFANADHLNYNGARKFTNSLMKEVISKQSTKF